MAKENGKNAPAVDPNIPHAGHAHGAKIEVEGWEDEQTGFPPYWEPKQDAQFKGIVTAVDNTNPEFVRYTIQATTHPIAAFKGGKLNNSQEPVVVKPGENFTVSDYVQLRLHEYIGHEVLVDVVNKVGIGDGHTMWNMRLRVSAATKALLLKQRADAAKRLPAAMGGGLAAPAAS